MLNFTLALFLAVGLTGSFTTQAQTFSAASSRPNPLPPATTQEEYNYATKGLQVQRANGLDMKAGYALSTPLTLPIGRYSVRVEDLVRAGTGTIACTILQVSDNPATPQGGTAYFCIPNPGSSGEIWVQYGQALRRVSGADFLQAVTYALSSRLSAMTTAVAVASH